MWVTMLPLLLLARARVLACDNAACGLCAQLQVLVDLCSQTPAELPPTSATVVGYRIYDEPPASKFAELAQLTASIQ